MGSRSEEQSELVVAAQVLEKALQRFETVTESLVKQKLDSGSAVERAGRLLTEATECEAHINESVVALATAIQALGQRQQLHGQKIQQRAEAIQQRSESYRQLLGQYEALGQAAQELNGRLKPLLGAANEPSNFAGAIIEIEAGGSDLAANAQTLVAQANEQGFSDIVRLADTLRQQLQSALNKLRLLATKVARA
jgi:ABC-type transporter Mla subunit MlaD